MRYLTLTIHAPLAAHGDTSMGRHRRSWPRPGKTAVMGMIAAAMGIARSRIDDLRALNNGFGFAVRVDDPGDAVLDYHTFAVGQNQPAKRARTRRYELRADKVETKITRREYRSGSIYTVALWKRDGAPTTLEAIADALQQPHWTLYVGRKSCPLGLPLNPEIIEADTLLAALEKRPPMPPEIAEFMGVKFTKRAELFADHDAAGINAQRIEQRRDHYHYTQSFAARDEHTMEIAQCI